LSEPVSAPAVSAKLVARVQTRATLSRADIATMYGLFAAHYDCTDATLFETDLAEKSHVILFHDGEKLCGFSTLTLFALPATAAHAACAALFSGDTIIAPDYWGEQALALEFCRFVGHIKAAQPALPLYWLLISKGYRTYRYLHLFARHYWPSHQTSALDSGLEAMLDRIASHKFGAAWERASGLIRFAHSRGQLRPDLAEVRAHLRERAEIAFFLDKNPRYAQGEELACLTLLELANLRGVARRAFLKGHAEAISEQGEAI
jgi:hypothetical protein